MTPTDPRRAPRDPDVVDDIVAALGPSVMVLDTTIGDFTAFLTGRFDPSADVGEHLTAIAWSFDTSGTHILLVDHPVLGWSCPGGHVESAEHPAAAAARELREETGVTARPRSSEPLTITRSHGCHRDPTATHWTIGYGFALDRAETVVGEAGQNARWFPVESLPEPRPRDIDRVIDAGRR